MEQPHTTRTRDMIRRDVGRREEEEEECNSYKAIKGVIVSEEPLIKTTTNKIKRQDNFNQIMSQL